MAQGIGSREGAPARASLPVIPGYELLERLGEGGMGEVFLARQLSLDREVAVKLVRRELLAEEWFLERLEREARLLARLRHPHLVTVHDFLRLPDGTAVVVMELVEGGSLRDRLRAAPDGLPLDEAVTLIRQVAAALAAAHAEGVVHRDIKPENVLLDAAGQVRVTDFGMALSLAPGAQRLTRTGATLGTPGYLAPEQLTGADTDARTDLFALGVLLYEMLTGRLPLGSFEPPRAVRPEIPAAVETALLRALKPNPADRPQDVAAWLELLAATAVEGARRVPRGGAR
jgi:serine/threonine-protein kinase